jgi:aspartate 1-decarboxylase
MLQSKIHRATVTDANLNYVGSITIDRELIEAAGLRIGQKIDIVDVNNGERFSTYIIAGKPGGREICLNGAAARKVHVGDKVILIAYAQMHEEEADTFRPRIVILDDANTIVQNFEGLE